MAAKIKISITVDADVLRQVDRRAVQVGLTRSATIEQWLRAGASRAAGADIEAATIAYYQSLGGEALAEDQAIARGLARAAKKLRYDDPQPANAVKKASESRSLRAGESVVSSRDRLARRRR